jgi:hypothetical protein
LEFKNSLNLDEFENKLKEDSASSALAAYQMTKGRYLYSAKREFQNSESINITHLFESMDYRTHKSHHKTLIDCIEKIQNDVNQGIPCHKIIKSYSSGLNFMKEADANSFLYKLIIASIHRNPLSRYKNKKTNTISSMILNLEKLQLEKKVNEINFLTSRFSYYISTFNEKLYFGVVDTNNQKLMPVADRLKLFISEIWGMQKGYTHEQSKEYFIDKMKSLHVIKSENLLAELVDNIFIMSQHFEVLGSLISLLNYYRLQALETSTLNLDTLAAKKTGRRGTFVGELARDFYYYKVKVDSWSDSRRSGRTNTDRDGYYYKTVEGRHLYYIEKGIFYDEQGREVHRVKC